MEDALNYNAIAWADCDRACRVLVVNKVIVLASAVDCAWNGTVKFDRWFTERFHPVTIEMTGPITQDQLVERIEERCCEAS